jgi:protein-tyrosine-phosphatase
MSERVLNVLFVCMANSSRSIMAEGILNALGTGRFQAFSAGIHPRADVNPFALERLRKWYILDTGYRSKSWNEFSAPGAPAIPACAATRVSPAVNWQRLRSIPPTAAF